MNQTVQVAAAPIGAADLKQIIELVVELVQQREVRSEIPLEARIANSLKTDIERAEKIADAYAKIAYGNAMLRLLGDKNV